MSLLTSMDVRRDQIAHTGDHMARLLRDGMAAVVEPMGHDRYTVYCIAPNRPGLGLAFLMRDASRAHVEIRRGGADDGR